MITQLVIDKTITIELIACDKTFQPQIGDVIEYYQSDRGMFKEMKISSIVYKVSVFGESSDYIRNIHGETQS